MAEIIGLNISEAVQVTKMSTLISAAVHINVAFVTFKMSLELFWRLVMEVSVIDCGCRRAWDRHMQQETAFQYCWHLMKWPFVCMNVCMCVSG